jgi:hypothetical protein
MIAIEVTLTSRRDDAEVFHRPHRRAATQVARVHRASWQSSSDDLLTHIRWADFQPATSASFTASQFMPENR